jgi:hypothetical protein
LGSYADQISKLPLVKLLEKSAGRDEVLETDVRKLHAAVLEAADVAGPLLERIPVTFKQYTEHNLGHSANLIRLMGKFIPKKTQNQLNAVELALLILTALLHDLGMFVSDAERRAFLESEEFQHFLQAAPDRADAIAEARAAGRYVTAGVIEDAVLADYFRRLHPQRARKHIEEHLGSVLRFREQSLVDAVADLCESHGWGVHESTDIRHPEKAIVKLNARARRYDVPVNEQYIAAALRLADIMDFDRSRTPLAVLKTVDFTEARSQAEWQKHLQIKGWEVTDREVAFQASCTKPDHYVAVMDFLDWIDVELRDCRRLLVRMAPHDIAQRYLFQLPPAVDRIDVEMADKTFVAGAFRFELDYERIMKLLMDRSLYPDPSLFLRELLQNSLDACRVRTALAQSEGAGDRYEARITVWDRSEEPVPTIVFQDNGVGMSRATIENYFMRVGRSYYRSNEFQAERRRLREKGVELEATSQFGIGFLSCFMVADRIEIETYRRGSEPLAVEIAGPTKYFTMRLLPVPERPEFVQQGETEDDDHPPRFPGTRITLHLRPGTVVPVEQTLRLFAVNVEVPVTIIGTAAKAEIQVFGWREAPERMLPRAAEGDDRTSPGVLSSLLVPLEVPLAQYDWCDGIDGRAVFWLLRDTDGQPAPDVGWLRVRETLDVSGPPSFISSEGPVAGLTPDATFEEDSLFSGWWQDHDRAAREKLIRHWNRLEKTEVWSKNEHAARALLGGGDAWLDHLVQFSTRGVFLQNWQRLALHGIALPAGITSWEPMSGSAYSMTLFSFPASFQVDIRRNAPIPAASRLFIDPIEGRRVGLALSRAFLHSAVNLYIRDRQKWQGWLNAICQGLIRTGYGAEVLKDEIKFLIENVHLSMETVEGSVLASLPEVLERFGSMVRMQRAFYEESPLPPPVLERTSLNQALLAAGRRETEDGVIEYDLDQVLRSVQPAVDPPG